MLGVVKKIRPLALIALPRADGSVEMNVTLPPLEAAVTVIATAFEVIPPLMAVMLLEPATTPVTSPPLEIVALPVSLELKVNAGWVARAVPLEFLPVAVQVLVAATARLVGVQLKAMLARVGAGGVGGTTTAYVPNPGMLTVKTLVAVSNV